MTDNLNKVPADPREVCLLKLHDVSYWTDRLGCSGAELRIAVAAVGTSPKKVAEYLDQFTRAQPCNLGQSVVPSSDAAQPESI